MKDCQDYAAIDGRFSHANMVAHLKAIIKEDEHGLIASSREKRHPKLYCPKWHKLVLVSALRQSHVRRSFRRTARNG